MTPVARLLPLVVVMAIAVRPATAHELGKTQVAALFQSHGGYQIDVTVDPNALLTTLEALGGEPVSPDLPRGVRDRRIAALSNVFLEHVVVRFDGAAVRPAFAYLPASAFNDMASVPSMVRLSGRIPEGARAATLEYGLALGTYAVNVRIGESPMRTLWVTGSEPSEAVSLVSPPAPATALDIVRQYFALGYTHILPNGVDHILFVIGIFLLSMRWRSVLLQVSTFTLAHSITLGLTMYGVVSLPARVVEPMIALSIAYVAIENLFTSELKSWRVALVFSFGLLHGMGFAGVLREIGLPRSLFVPALVSFNVGVEAGQLSVIAIAFVAVAWWRNRAVTYRRLIVQPASVVIALIGLYWTIQRAFM